MKPNFPDQPNIHKNSVRSIHFRSLLSDRSFSLVNLSTLINLNELPTQLNLPGWMKSRFPQNCALDADDYMNNRYLWVQLSHGHLKLLINKYILWFRNNLLKLYFSSLNQPQLQNSELYLTYWSNAVNIESYRIALLNWATIYEYDCRAC